MRLTIFRSGAAKRLTTAAILLATALTLPYGKVMAVDIATGIGAVEEGDDRGQAAALLHLGLANQWYSRFYLWGRSYGPVTETNAIITAAKQTQVFGSKSLTASAGISVMANQTAITYKDYPSENSSYTNTNFGLLLGLRYDIVTTKSFNLAASWDSHIFAAGDAVILLVTGRKQILGLTAGISL